MATSTNVHRFQASLFPVNAYLVETADTVVAIDATLGVSDGRALARRVLEIGKPLAGVLVTHGHPDHYGGIAPLTEGAPVPVYAIAGVDRVIRRDDGEKELIMRPLFGDEWATARRFPDHIVGDGERVTIGGASFRVIDTGPGESRHDSWWMLEGDGPPRVFPGDLVYNHMHAYLADGFHEAWLSNIGRAKRELPKDVRLYPGHGEPASGHGLLDWQVQYIDRLLETLRSAVERDGLEGEPLAEAVMAKMKAFLATDDLLFLARLSVEPLRHQLTLGAKP